MIILCHHLSANTARFITMIQNSKLALRSKVYLYNVISLFWQESTTWLFLTSHLGFKELKFVYMLVFCEPATCFIVTTQHIYWSILCVVFIWIAHSKNKNDNFLEQPSLFFLCYNYILALTIERIREC